MWDENRLHHVVERHTRAMGFGSIFKVGGLHGRQEETKDGNINLRLESIKLMDSSFGKFITTLYFGLSLYLVFSGHFYLVFDSLITTNETRGDLLPLFSLKKIINWDIIGYYIGG